jgi:hypothetical protein
MAALFGLFEPDIGATVIFMPESAQWLREQAERCLRLARAVTANDVADRLRALAADYLERATKLEGARPVTQQQQQIQPKEEQ